MHTITVKYLSPTNSRGSRFKATCSYNPNWSLTHSLDYSLSDYANHIKTGFLFYKKFRYQNGFNCGEVTGFGWSKYRTVVFTFSDSATTLEHGLKLLSEKSLKELA